MFWSRSALNLLQLWRKAAFRGQSAITIPHGRGHVQQEAPLPTSTPLSTTLIQWRKTRTPCAPRACCERGATALIRCCERVAPLVIRCTSVAHPLGRSGSFGAATALSLHGVLDAADAPPVTPHVSRLSLSTPSPRA